MGARIAGLEAVLITPRLAQRAPRPAAPALEDRALEGLSDVAPAPPHALQKIADVALSLCQAGSAGFSLLHPPLGDRYLRWRAVAGEFAPHAGVITPRDFSPCGTALDFEAAQLFHYPGRIFTYLNGLGAPVMELLVVPIQAGNRAIGTLWVAGHETAGSGPQAGRRFDAGDLRLMARLAGFAASAILRLEALEAGAAAPPPDRAHWPLRLPWWRRLSSTDRR